MFFSSKKKINISEIENDTPDCLKEPCMIYIYDIPNRERELKTVNLLRNYFDLEELDPYMIVAEVHFDGLSEVSGYIAKHELLQLVSEFDKIGLIYEVK